MFRCNLVTCHLHVWQNDRGLLSATAVTRGGTDTEQKKAQKVNTEEESSPAAPAGNQTRNLSFTSPALCHQVTPAPICLSVCLCICSQWKQMKSAPNIISCTGIYPSSHSSVRPSVFLSLHPSSHRTLSHVQGSIHLSIHPSVCLSVYQSIQSSIYTENRIKSAVNSVNRVKLYPHVERERGNSVPQWFKKKKKKRGGERSRKNNKVE